MKRQKIEIPYEIYAISELDGQDRELMQAALEATRRSYAPYSHFHVGAAVRLEDGSIVTGNNQENVAYPSGLCAERTALFYANSRYPDQAVTAMAIVATTSEGTPFEGIITPCGACRQVMQETEKRYGKPMKVLLMGKDEVIVIANAQSLLPFAFDKYEYSSNPLSIL